MYSNEIIQLAKKLKELGLNLNQISNKIAVSRATLREWFSENKKYVSKNTMSRDNDFFNRFEESDNVRQAYYYILGQYFGDGCVSKNGRAFSLRISATKKYSKIIDEIEKAMKIVLPNNKVYKSKSGENCLVVTVNSKHLPEIFPHCGNGKKHERKIELTEWQLKYFEENSKWLARGLFHSDGCLYSKNDRKWYVFSNCSTDIHNIYQRCLQFNSIYYNYSNKQRSVNESASWNTLIYRKNEIEKAYAFLGEKE